MRANACAALLACLAALPLSAHAQTCTVCGVVSAIREVNAGAGPTAGAERRTPGPVGSPSALDTGPVVGTVARFEFDRSLPGNDSVWRLGSAGTPEMQKRLGETYYELTVAMDGGELRTVQRRDGNRFHVGQRVALRSGELEPM
jgi:hypothetical protein